MQEVAKQTATASVIFFVLMVGFDVLVRGAAFNGTTLMANIFITLIFAMAYAAIRVALIIFRGNGE